MSLNVDYYGFSVKGRRENNEDAYLAEQLVNDSYLFAVADGMGGTKGGEIASSIALHTIFEFINGNHKSSDRTTLSTLMAEAFLHSNLALKQKQEDNPELNGMGTTLTALLISESNYVIGHIGDSRAYLLNDEKIEQITKDHTYIQDYIESHNGELPEEIRQKYNHYLLKALDGGEAEAEFFPSGEDSAVLPESGAFMLCSDGLILDKAYTNIQLLSNYITGSPDCETAAKNLIQYAFHNGSSDNITALVISFGKFKRKALNLRLYQEINDFANKKDKKRRFFRKFRKR